jgi:Tol biopolymer transport system component
MAFANPSIDGTMVVFVRQTLGGMQLYSFNLSARKQTLLHQLSKRSGRYLWTTGINGGTFYATVYDAESSWITAI